jgi:hypothetical protein
MFSCASILFVASRSNLTFRAFSRGVLDSFLFQLSIVGSNALERAMYSGVIPRDEALEAILVVPADKGIPWCPEPTR